MVYSDHLELFVIFVITKCCNLLCVYCYPSCVEVIVGLCFGFVGIPLSAELSEFWLCAYPSKRRGNLCLA